MNIEKKLEPCNTNLATEFFVLSLLNRLGLKSYLTLGNQKSVDIIVEKAGNKFFTIDVKGAWWGQPFLLGAKKPFVDNNHFYICVRLTKKRELEYAKVREQLIGHTPFVYVIPSKDMNNLTEKNKKGYNINQNNLGNYYYKFDYFV